MSESKGFQLGTMGALTLSVVSSVSIVICNKALMSTLHFIFATTLTSWHLLVTFCSLHVALSMKFFEHKPIESQTVVGFGILNGISIGLLNLSLGFNSVGFYQMTKLAIIPCTVLLETLFLSKTFSRNIKLSLVILLLGVGIATVTDLQLNVLGSILSLLAVISTCVAQIVSFFHSDTFFALLFLLLITIWSDHGAQLIKRYQQAMMRNLIELRFIHVFNNQKKMKLSDAEIIQEHLIHLNRVFNEVFESFFLL